MFVAIMFRIFVIQCWGISGLGVFFTIRLATFVFEIVDNSAVGFARASVFDFAVGLVGIFVRKTPGSIVGAIWHLVRSSTLKPPHLLLDGFNIPGYYFVASRIS